MTFLEAEVRMWQSFQVESHLNTGCSCRRSSMVDQLAQRLFQYRVSLSEEVHWRIGR